MLLQQCLPANTMAVPISESEYAKLTADLLPTASVRFASTTPLPHSRTLPEHPPRLPQGEARKAAVKKLSKAEKASLMHFARHGGLKAMCPLLRVRGDHRVVLVKVRLA